MKTFKIFLFIAILTYAALGILGVLEVIPSAALSIYFERTSLVLGILLVASGSIALLFKKNTSSPPEQNSSHGPQF